MDPVLYGEVMFEVLRVVENLQKPQVKETLERLPSGPMNLVLCVKNTYSVMTYDYVLKALPQGYIDIEDANASMESLQTMTNSLLTVSNRDISDSVIALFDSACGDPFAALASAFNPVMFEHARKLANLWTYYITYDTISFPVPFIYHFMLVHGHPIEQEVLQKRFEKVYDLLYNWLSENRLRPGNVKVIDDETLKRLNNVIYPPSIVEEIERKVKKLRGEFDGRGKKY